MTFDLILIGLAIALDPDTSYGAGWRDGTGRASRTRSGSDRDLVLHPHRPRCCGHRGAVARSMSGLPYVAAQAIQAGLLIGIGVQKAVHYSTPPPGAILLGVVTGTFGATIADVLAGRRATILERDRHLFLAVIVLGAVVFWACTEYISFHLAVVGTVVIVAGLRETSVRFNWTRRVIHCT